MDKPVAIDRLISPLRYDVLVRLDYFFFLEDHRGLFESDFEAFTARAREQPYYIWFREIVFPRLISSRPRADLEPEFRKRLRKASRLFEGFRRRGFDPRFPITVRYAGIGLSNGQNGSERYHLVDGCHRLALLLAAGHTMLTVDMCRVRLDPVVTPLDNTAVLLSRLQVTSSEYFSFLSRGYAQRECRDKASLLAHVRRTTPSRLAELESIIARHESALQSPKPVPSERMGATPS